MNIIELTFTAVALAMDAFAVSVSGGMCIKKFRKRYALKFGWYFGIFQFAMTVLGYVLAFSFAGSVEAFGHWIAFIFLCIIGGRMFCDTFTEEELDINVSLDEVIGTKNMVIMALATSVDAMAVGVSFALLRGNNILVSAGVIGIFAFVISSAGAIIGNKIGGVFKKNAQRIGGIILIVMGFHIIFEHMVRSILLSIFK